MPILLFDIDGTITVSGQKINNDMIHTIKKLSSKGYVLGLVGGGTLAKIQWQMDDACPHFKYIFAECGAVINVDGVTISEKNMLHYCNRPLLNQLIKTALLMISKMPIIYHGNQIDFRKGLVYISPPGIQATNYERSIFLEKDKELNLKHNLLQALKAIDVDNSFEITYGGEIGIAIQLLGWNKSQVVDFFATSSNDIYYFGDKAEPDGNDYPILAHPLIKGVAVKDYHDTIQKLTTLFAL